MRALTIRAEDSKLKDINNVIDETILEKGFSNKGDAIHYITVSYKKMKNDNVSGEYIAPNARETLLDIDCEYIIFQDETFYCLDKTHESKKKADIGMKPEYVKTFCTKCKIGKQEKIRKEEYKILQKDYIRKLIADYAFLIKIIQEGIIVTPSWCSSLVHTDESRTINSIDGVTLDCTLLDNKNVDIEEYCKEQINPHTGNVPCQYLMSWMYKHTIDKKTFKDIPHDIEDITKVLSIDTLLEDKTKQNERLDIDADFKVITDEEKEEEK